MARPEQIEQLDRQIAAAVKRAVQDFQDELSMRIRSATGEITRLVEETTLSLPSAYVTAQDLEPLEPEARPEPRTLGSGELLAAARHLDSARTQAGVLTALLEAAGGFSARAAVFLTRGEDVRGWRGDGFGDHGDLGALTFDLGETPWNDLASGTGCVPLSAGDCARITSRLDVPLAQGGTLIPLVLRDQVAAALYADRSENSHWNLEALQVLTHLAALAVETLPFRARAQTPTLVEIGGAGDGLPIWTGEPETASEWAEEPDQPAMEEDFGEPATDYAAEAAAVAAPAPETSEFADSAPVSPWGEPDLQDAPAAALAEPAPARKWYQLAQPEAVDTAAGVPEPQAPAQESADSYWKVEESAPAEVEESPDVARAAPVEYEPVAQPEPPPLPPTPVAPWYAPPPPIPPPLPAPATGGALSTVAIPAPIAEDDATLMLRRPGFQEPIPPLTPPPMPSMPPAPEAPRYGDADEPTHPGLSSGRGQTSPIPIPPPRTWQPGETAEVAPPPDVEGPGWAFASKPVAAAPSAPDDAALHEEARRLARLLVSEIKLYNEERVEEGRRNKDIYERLKEDIDRSRQMYEERVDSRILRSTDYFYQELVRILAAGDARALGI